MKDYVLLYFREKKDDRICEFIPFAILINMNLFKLH